MPFTPEDLERSRKALAEIRARSGGACVLREQIELAIRKHASDPAAAAVAVCVVLENEIGLAGNGWFDGDNEVIKAIEEE